LKTKIKLSSEKKNDVAPRFFSFLYFFSLNFVKIYGLNFFCRTIHLAPWGTALGTYHRAPRR
jgi:hypothetical protein